MVNICEFSALVLHTLRFWFIFLRVCDFFFALLFNFFFPLWLIFKTSSDQQPGANCKVKESKRTDVKTKVRRTKDDLNLKEVTHLGGNIWVDGHILLLALGNRRQI